jgi:hypothetical protein
MNEHRLIELARTERAIAAGLRAIEEQHEILAERLRCGQDVILAQQTLKALRHTQQQHVAHREQLLRELEKMCELEKKIHRTNLAHLARTMLPAWAATWREQAQASVARNQQARLGATVPFGQHSDRTVDSSIRYP